MTDPDYHVAVFGLGGTLIGTRGRSASELSPRWMDFWREVLGTSGPVFRGPLPMPPLSHIELRLTGSDGVALTSFSVRGQPVSSGIALTGQVPAAEAEVLKMFVDSLRRVRTVHAVVGDEPPFEAMFHQIQRPLYIVMIWGNLAVDEEDDKLVTELENHLAAALLCNP